MNYHFKWTYQSSYYELSKCLAKAASVTSWHSYLETIFYYVQCFQREVLSKKKKKKSSRFLENTFSGFTPTPGMFKILFHFLLASMVSDETSTFIQIVTLLLVFCFLYFFLCLVFSNSIMLFLGMTSLDLRHLRFNEPLESTRQIYVLH